MPTFDIIKSAHPGESFRVKSVMGTYDLQSSKITEHFKGEIELPPQWNIGLIVGRSGTGKSTIAREMFGDALVCDYKYTHESILDDMPQDASVAEITAALSSVGFASPPSWMKSYSMLSNGEKMRCDLARAILEKRELFVFDEFTSVVDRDVAKIGSLAMQKTIRRQGRKFIAVSCHNDIEEWLMPDWVFNTDSMTFSTKDLEEQKKNRPGICLDIVETRRKQDYWHMFSKYHYLTGSFHPAARVWVCFANGKLAGFCSFMALPHPIVKNYWKAHRVVVFPDYQGVGIATNMLDQCGMILKKEGKRVLLTSSNLAMIIALKKNPKWRCVRYGRQTPINKTTMKSFIATSSRNRITAQFEMN